MREKTITFVPATLGEVGLYFETIRNTNKESLRMISIVAWKITQWEDSGDTDVDPVFSRFLNLSDHSDILLINPDGKITDTCGDTRFNSLEDAYFEVDKWNSEPKEESLKNEA